MLKYLAAIVVIVFFASIAYGNNISMGIEISEIMYDSSTNDAGGEWIELYNFSGGSINLAAFGFEDNWGTTPPGRRRTISHRAGWGNIAAIPNNAFFVITEPASTVDFDTLYSNLPSATYVGVANDSFSLDNSSPGAIRFVHLGPDGGFEGGDDTEWQNFAYPDKATDQSMFKNSISGDEDISDNWLSDNEDYGYGAGYGNPGAFNTAQTVPEPSAMMLLIPGLFAVLFLRRVKK